MSTLKKIVFLIIPLLLLIHLQPSIAREAEKNPSLIRNIAISKRHINPSQGETVSITIEVAASGELTVQVLDRDGFITRDIAKSRKVTAGETSYEWEGRTNEGSVVPDEAYSWRVVFKSAGRQHVYFPADLIQDQISIQSNFYDRQNGLLSYFLEKPSRVHILATSGNFNVRKNQFEGATLKVISNREPRLAGSVLEYWKGFDESGTILVSDLPGFGISIVAEPLPENSVIAIGNTNSSFLETISKRVGSSLLNQRKRADGHKGLISYHDVSPILSVKPMNAVYSPMNRYWSVKETKLKLACTFEGPMASAFLNQPGKLHVFVDAKSIQKMPGPKSDFYLEIPIADLSSHPHVLALNWDTDVGPVIATSLCIRKETN